MEALRFFAFWLLAFGVAGTHCLGRDPVTVNNYELLEEQFYDSNALVRGSNNFHAIDQQQRGETPKNRVVRYIPSPDSPYHPTDDELQRARDREMRLRAEAERTENARRAASARLRQEEESRRAGEIEMAQRIKYIKRTRPKTSR